MVRTATINGYIKAQSSSPDINHPLQSRATLILTDFEGNLNKQGVPEAEKHNLMKSAMYMPLKINFDGNDFHGHASATPLGPIVRIWEGDHEGRRAIFGEAIIWTELYKDTRDHLQTLLSEGFSTSWEIYYSSSTFEDGIEWLNDVVFAGTCIVETPAYGPERTRVLAISEILKGENVSKTDTTEETTSVTPDSTTTDTEVTPDVAISSTEGDAIRQDLANATDILFSMYDQIERLYSTVYEIEAAQADKNLATINDNFSTLINDIVSKVNTLRSESQANAEKISAYEQAEAAQAQAQAYSEKQKARRNQLLEAGLNYTDEAWAAKEPSLMALTDEAFTLIASEFRTINQTKAQSSTTTISIIPEPLNPSNDVDIVAALRERNKR